MIIALTGHTNIEKANGFSIQQNGETYHKDAYDIVYQEIENDLKAIAESKGVEFKDLTLVSGMARGADEVLADVAFKNGLKLILSIPHTIHWHKNRTASRGGTRAQAINYDKFLNYENLVTHEIKKSYGEGNHKYANFARNQHMVDVADYLISYKRYNSAGTDDCIRRGKKQDKYLGNVGSLKLDKVETQLAMDFDS